MLSQVNHRHAFRVRKINNVKVNPIQLEKVDPKKIKGYDLIEEPYANIYMVAHKKSGKTTCIFKILKECTNKDTKLVFFGSTIYNDPAWKHIFKFFKNRGNPILKYTSIMDDGIDQLQEIMDSLKEEGRVEVEEEDREKEEPKKPVKYIAIDDDEPEQKRKKRKPKKLAPENIFVFDDLSKSMRIPSFSTLLKTNRHYMSKVIISSQNVKDIQPEARENINVLILFKDIKEELLKTIHEDFHIKLEYPSFVDLYKNATKPKYSFLYIDIDNNVYRQRFDILIEPQ